MSAPHKWSCTSNRDLLRRASRHRKPFDHPRSSVIDFSVAARNQSHLADPWFEPVRDTREFNEILAPSLEKQLRARSAFASLHGHGR
jgi:hypothetical protein